MYDYKFKKHQAMKLHNMKKWLHALLFVVAVLPFAACGGDDDSNGGGSGNINPNSLVGWAFEKYEQWYDSYQAGTIHWTIEFKSANFVVVNKAGTSYDGVDGRNNWDNGKIDCMYRVEGNKVIINYENDWESQQLVLNFVNGVPEGWVESKRGSTPITTGGSSSSGDSSATSGSNQMFGYYCSDSFYEGMMSNFRDLTAMGDYYINSWKSYQDGSYWGHGYQIVDGSTINLMYECVEVNTTGRAPQPKSGWNPVVYRTEQFFGNAGSQHVTIYVFFYYLADYVETYKYVMNGSTIEVSNGDRLEYKGSYLVDPTRKYTYTKQ
jgi:hypothetical protein